MNIVINGTNELRTLTLIDHNTGCDCIQDFVGNTGALCDGQFTWNEELDAYTCDQETFDWWEKVVDENQELEYRLDELEESVGRETIYEIMSNIGCDLEDFAAAANYELDRVA